MKGSASFWNLIANLPSKNSAAILDRLSRNGDEPVMSFQRCRTRRWQTEQRSRRSHSVLPASRLNWFPSLHRQEPDINQQTKSNIIYCCKLLQPTWQFGTAVALRRINEVILRWARSVLGSVTVFLAGIPPRCVTMPTRSTQPCITIAVTN